MQGRENHRFQTLSAVEGVFIREQQTGVEFRQELAKIAEMIGVAATRDESRLAHVRAVM